MELLLENEGFSVQRRRRPKQRPVKSKKKLNEVSYEVSVVKNANTVIPGTELVK
jgi:hypothetical protein